MNKSFCGCALACRNLMRVGLEYETCIWKFINFSCVNFIEAFVEIFFKWKIRVDSCSLLGKKNYLPSKIFKNSLHMYKSPCLIKKKFLHTYSWRHCKTHIKYNLIKGTFTPNHFNSGSTCIINILRTYLGIKNSHEHIQWTTKNGFTLFYGEWRMTERQVVGEYTKARKCLSTYTLYDVDENRVWN